MAAEYAKVLSAQNLDFTVIGRGETSADKFEAETGARPITGGVDNYLDHHPFPEGSCVIIATGTEILMPILLKVLKKGAAKVLIEKPAAISIEELLANEGNLKPYFDKVHVAYNRRFYASVIETQRLIEEDGGLQSMHFEFTEWAHRIEPIPKAPGVKKNWFFANSTHVVDLAFYIAGKPKVWQAFSKAGQLTWHKKTNFAGAGLTEKDVLFSYISNWESAGRWAIELLTDKRRIYLKPLEDIGIQLKGTIPVVEHTFDDSLDKQFKPGLYRQVAEFVSGKSRRLVPVSEHVNSAKIIYSKMLK